MGSVGIGAQCPDWRHCSDDTSAQHREQHKGNPQVWLAHKTLFVSYYGDILLFFLAVLVAWLCGWQCQCTTPEMSDFGISLNTPLDLNNHLHVISALYLLISISIYCFTLLVFPCKQKKCISYFGVIFPYSTNILELPSWCCSETKEQKRKVQTVIVTLFCFTKTAVQWTIENV